MIKNMQIQLAKLKSKCCGCGLCYAVCPADAIVMREDIQGFLYPEIDEAKCVKCCKCINECILNIKD